jgi:hypothetical protein
MIQLAKNHPSLYAISVKARTSLILSCIFQLHLILMKYNKNLSCFQRTETMEFLSENVTKFDILFMSLGWLPAAVATQN